MLSEEKACEARVRMPASNTQGYINGGANVAARAAELAADPVQLDKAAKRMASRWGCSGGVAERSAAVLVTESAVLAEFDPTLLAFKTDKERAEAREGDLERKGKRTRQTLIGLLRVVESWARTVLGKDEARAAGRTVGRWGWPAGGWDG